MRHRVYGRHLSRTKNQRTALFKNLVRSLLIHESINTTEAKAKAVKGLVDKLVTQAKTPTTRRLISQFLVDKEVSEKLVKDLVPRMKDRNSGYTTITRLGKRPGDGTMLVQMSLLVSAPKKEEVAKPVKLTEEKKAEAKVATVKPSKAPKKASAKKEIKK